MDIFANIWSFLFKFFELINGFALAMNDFLFNEVKLGFTIPIINYEVGISFIPFWAIGLPVAVVLLVMSIVKSFIPLA